MVTVLLRLVRLVVCRPIGLLALIVYPLLWVLVLPFRPFGIAVEGVFELLRAMLMLPVRVLGGGTS